MMMLWLAALLVETNVFIRVEFSFLAVGHTHMQLDQLFSRISSTTNSKNLFCLPDTMAHVDELFKECGWSHNDLVHDIIDIRAMTRDLVFDFSGLGVIRDEAGHKHSVHAIRVEKPSADSVPVVYYKEDDRSSTPWLGDFTNKDEGIPILKRRLPDNYVPDILPGNRTPLKNFKEAKARVQALLDSLLGSKKRSADQEPPPVYTHVKTYYDELWAEEESIFPPLPVEGDDAEIPFPTPLTYVTSWPRSRQTVQSVHQLQCNVALSYLDDVKHGLDPGFWLPGNLYFVFFCHIHHIVNYIRIQFAVVS